MIFSNKKQCTIEGCTFPIFARKMCHSHYKTLFLYPKMNQLDKERQEKGIKTKSKKIPYIAKEVPEKGEHRKIKGSSKESRYRRNRLRFIAKERLKDPGGRLFCIFCGKVIMGEPSLHHYDGRDGSLLLDQSKWLLSHNRCHVFEYHSMGWGKVKWWPGYLKRISYDYPDLYLKELKKMEK